MSLRHEIGICRAWAKQTDGAYLLHPDEYPALLAAWQAGKAFWTGRDLYGGEMVLRLADIAAIGRAGPEHVQRAEADEKTDSLLGA